MVAKGRVAQSEIAEHAFEVPPGLAELKLTLTWQHGWDRWPTNDLDLTLVAPSGAVNREGSTLAAPERVTLVNPAPGTWTARVHGFTVWTVEDDDDDDDDDGSDDDDDDGSGRVVRERYKLRASPGTGQE